MEYAYTVITFALLSLLLAQSFNLVFGIGKLFNLAHISSYAIGAYSCAILQTEYGLSFITATFTGVLICVCLASLISLVATRLVDDYFVIATIAFSALTFSVLVNARSLTKGMLGISGIPRPVLLGLDLQNNQTFLLVLLAISLVTLSMLQRISVSPFGLGLKAQAESESAAQSLGINTGMLKYMAFVVSSAVAGFAGAMFASYMQYIDPTSFTFAEIIPIVTIVMLGRPGSFWGCVWATIVVALIPEILRFIAIPSDMLGPIRQICLASILFLMVYLRRDAIFPIERQF